MASDEWYRSAAWDADARADFEARLRRARAHNRPQYLRIKAHALAAAGNSADADVLSLRVVNEYPGSLDAASCGEALGDGALARGDFVAAEEHYRRCIELRPDLNLTSGEVHIGLAEALTAQGRPDEALQALDSVPPGRLVINHALCRWNAALAEASFAVGEEPVVAAMAASRALSLLDTPDQFTRHPGVGRARLRHDRIERLRAIASGEEAPPPTRRRFLRRR
jgi:tetratricopeptide (TPR) repeat protein